MPGNTPIYNFTFPVPTDLVINGPQTIQQLAEDVEGTISSVLATNVPASRQVVAGTGLSGGGPLSSNITLSAAFGSTGGTVAEGNDTRIVNAVQSTRQVSAGTGLQGGGDLTADRTLSANFGTISGTIAEGNDTRIVNAVQSTRQISAGTGLTGGGNLSADVTLSVDAANLALDTAFADRYAPVDAPIWMPVGQMNFDTGTRVIVNDATDAIEMAESVDSYALGMVQIPSQWIEASLTVVWANAGAGSGDVEWEFFADGTTVASDISSLPALTPAQIVAAGSQYDLTLTVGPSIATDDYLRFKVMRAGTSGSDTLSNDVYLVGVVISRSL